LTLSFHESNRSLYESLGSAADGIFRTQVQGEILARVLLAEEPVTIADLARELGSPLPTVAREVNRLGEAGILTVVRHGRGSLVSGTEANPAVAPLRDLVAVAFGPRFVVGEEFSPAWTG
jgi:DNA-binding transcriptional ArsR family regulator